MSEIWQSSEGHLIERKCVAHSVRACFQCGAMDPLIKSLNDAARKKEIFMVLKENVEELGVLVSKIASTIDYLQSEEPCKTAKDYPTKVCRDCCYGSHCLGADPDCVCCQPSESESIRRAELFSMNPETAEKIDRDRKM
jgi:hypothetical protein